MDFERLKHEVKEIAAIASEVPEPFRDRCFEILLQQLVTTIEPAKQSPFDPNNGNGNGAGSVQQQTAPIAQGSNGEKLRLPAQIRVFMQRTGVSEDQLASILTVADGDVHFLREPTTSTVAQGQTEWALLLALRNGILSNSISVDPEAVRSICQEKGFYDRKNFSSYFRREKTAKLFRGTMEPQGEPQPLTSDGQAELGKLVKALAARTE